MAFSMIQSKKVSRYHTTKSSARKGFEDFSCKNSLVDL